MNEIIHVVILQGGAVWVDSTGRGCGSAFHFCIPANLAHAPSSSPPPLPANTTTAPPPAATATSQPCLSSESTAAAAAGAEAAAAGYHPQGLPLSHDEGMEGAVVLPQRHPSQHQVLYPPPIPTFPLPPPSPPAQANGRFSLDQGQQVILFERVCECFHVLSHVCA